MEVKDSRPFVGWESLFMELGDEMYLPTLEEVKKLARYGNLIPVYREIMADLETPVSAFLKIARGDYSFLFESVEGGEKLARYSFIGTEPALVLKTGSANPVNPLVGIERELARFKLVPNTNLPRFHGGMVGYLGYEVAGYFESIESPCLDQLELPESVFMMADALLIFDHLTHKIKVVAHVYAERDIEQAYREATEKIDVLIDRLEKPVSCRYLSPSSSLTSLSSETSNFTQEEFMNRVDQAKEYIYAGDIIQVVLSQRLARPTDIDPFTLYRTLRSINPSPYMYYLSTGDCVLVGASPELLVRVEDGVISNHPIAGTRKRGRDDEEDRELEEELKSDEKECAEHIMLVDLGRNDVGRVSKPGTVRVTQLMGIERYSHVMHLVSHIEGELRDDMSQYEALRACFPAGTVSGAPKIRAMEIIAELEKSKRGPYAGAIGYFGFSGSMDTAINIRTSIFKDGVAYTQAGAGIVADSKPDLEYQESLNKAQALISAIEQAEMAVHAYTD